MSTTIDIDTFTDNAVTNLKISGEHLKATRQQLLAMKRALTATGDTGALDLAAEVGDYIRQIEDWERGIKEAIAYFK